MTLNLAIDYNVANMVGVKDHFAAPLPQRRRVLELDLVEEEKRLYRTVFVRGTLKLQLFRKEDSRALKQAFSAGSLAGIKMK